MLIYYKSIRVKFLTAVAATSLVTLLVTIVFMGIYDWNDYKSRWVNDLSNQATLLGRATIPALQFDDPQLATKYLRLLDVRTRVRSAALYDGQGRIYARYRGAQYPDSIPANFRAQNVHIANDDITVSRPIEQNNTVVGYMLITAEYGLYKRLFNYFGILLLVGSVAFLISQLVARWLQQQITRPIESIAQLAKQVVEQRNYALRAVKTTDDEVGYLVNAFNTMLSEIEKGNQAQETALSDLAYENQVRKMTEAKLQEAHDQLEHRVQERTAELRKTQEALLQSQKLEAVGQLTGGVAHDFNNILQIIGSNLEILAMKHDGHRTAPERIASALNAVDKGARLASHLLAFARRQPLQPVPTNLNNLTNHMDELLRRALGESVEIEVINGGGLWNVMVDRNQVENVILNLAINARDAMDHRGHLTIETSNVMLDELYAENNPEVVAGQYVMLAISDTGCGMNEEVLSRAFEPFFTTKGEGKGSGLGLSMAYGLVKQSGGHIKIYSELGHGTTIKIYFPRVHLVEAENPVKAPPDIEGGSEAILVVEDDVAVQKAAKDILTSLGYRVQSASDAQSALAIIEQGQHFDLLFTDVVMPGPLKSSDMAKMAVQKLPNLAVLFTSGYTQNAIVHGGRLDAGVELINKPYRYPDLARKIRQLLEKNKKDADMTTTPSKDESVPGQTKILVVEDNEEAQATLCELLMLLGYDAVGLSSGEEALKQVAGFDIVLTDLNLPKMSGLELAEKIHALHPDKPIIISSGMDVVPQLSFEVQLLPKPFNVKVLSDILNKLKS